ncbi:MAG: peptidyl-prolyl cis-trans isomerase [Gemmataceae bacterium]
MGQPKGWRALAGIGIVAAGIGIMADRAMTQTPPPVSTPAASQEPTQVAPNTRDYGSRPVAYIYGNVAITRADLAEFLIARGGYDRVEMLVNKMIIETEAQKRGITVTPIEMEAALGEDLKGINVKKEDFISAVLPKYNKTLFEWMEDVVRPRLLLTKMCKANVKVAEEDLKLEFERQYGEKRDVRIIIWPESDGKKNVLSAWDQARKSDDEFLRMAKQQANPSLAGTAGHIKPINKHLVAEDKIVETTAFSLREGEVSQVLETKQGYMVMKLLRIIPPDVNAKYESVKDRISGEVFDMKLSQEIPKMFAELSKLANPQILMKGPPPAWRFEKSNKELAEDVRNQPAAGAPVVLPAGGKK